VELLLERGARLDAPDSREETPLHYAAHSRDAVELIKLLVARGANPNAPSRNGPPLHRAARAGLVENIQVLVASGAELNTKGKETDAKSALEAAVEGRSAEAALALLELGAEPNVESYYNGFVTIPHREEPGTPEKKGLFLRVSKANFERMTPLHVAVTLGNLELVRALLDRGARMDVQSHFYGHALDFAIHLEEYAIADLLLERGSRSMHSDSELSRAVSRNDARLAQLCLRAGADANRVEPELGGRTPLHHAATADAVTVAEVLLRAGADPRRTDRTGRTPSELATSPEMKRVLGSAAREE